MSISGLKMSVSGHKISISSLQKGWSLPNRKINEIDHFATPEGMAPHCYKNKWKWPLCHSRRDCSSLLQKQMKITILPLQKGFRWCFYIKFIMKKIRHLCRRSHPFWGGENPFWRCRPYSLGRSSISIESLIMTIDIYWYHYTLMTLCKHRLVWGTISYWRRSGFSVQRVWQ